MENQEILNQNAPITLEEQYNRSLEMFKGGGTILLENQALTSKIIASGQAILNKIQANGGKLDPEMDRLCNDFIAKANQRRREMEEKRKPVTQMMTAVQKLFTTEEGKLDITKPDTVMAILQNLRNSYAKELAEEAKKRQAEADRAAKKGQEAINLKAECERLMNQYFNDYMLQKKQSLQTRFNALKLESFDTSAEKLKTYVPAYPYAHYEEFKPRLFAQFHTPEEVQSIINLFINGGFDPFANKYKFELGELRDSLIARLPSKRNELISLQEADEEEKQRISEEQECREKAAADKLKQEAENAQKQAEMNISSNAAAEETMVLFEKEAAVAVDTPAPETRQGYEIEVLHNAGYVQLFQLWFEHEGKSLPADKLEKKTVGAMKKFCEALAHKNDFKIDSKFIVYNASYKAVNRKAKEE